MDGNAKTVKPTERVPLTGSTSGTVKTSENVGTVAENEDGNAKTVNPSEVPFYDARQREARTERPKQLKTWVRWPKTWTETRKRCTRRNVSLASRNAVASVG